MSLPTDYYRVLSVNRDATELQLLQAYRRAALQSHPQKNADKDPKITEKEFSLITEAYDVLRHPHYRAIFDQFGERGLKAGVTLADGSATEIYKFSQLPTAVFESVFGTDSAFAAQLTENNTATNTAINTDAKPAAQEIKLFLSLEELYSGCVRTVKVTRRFYNPEGTVTLDDRALVVEIGRGWKPNTRITFDGEGDRNDKGVSGDVTIIVCERPHPVYRRAANNDLLLTHTLSLVDALCGSTLPLTTLDGRTLTVALSQVLAPESKHTVTDEGMPRASGNGFANLVIDFKLVFPDQLSLRQKQELRTILGQ